CETSAGRRPSSCPRACRASSSGSRVSTSTACRLDLTGRNAQSAAARSSRTTSARSATRPAARRGRVADMGRTIALTPFFNELDVLEVRLATLDPVVDLHVIAEARTTFAGERKPLLLQQHWERFEPWHDKIRYLHVEGMPKGDQVYAEPGTATTACASDRWRRENHQRDFLGEGLHDLEDDDLLFLSDLDEIPNPEAFHQG